MSPVERLLERARSMLGRHTVYWPGAGGEHADAPSAASMVRVADEWPDLDAATQAELRPLAEAAGIDVNDPAQMVSAADCSGYIAWVLGMARHRVPPQPGVGEWISTDSIHGDATHGAQLFRTLAEAVPGCLVVYPKPAHLPFGHVGLVSETANGRAVRVLHCAAANFKSAPFDAIKENAPTAFEAIPTSIYVWCRTVPTT